MIMEFSEYGNGTGDAGVLPTRSEGGLVGDHTATVGPRWQLRAVPGDLARSYLARGWWNDATL